MSYFKVVDLKGDNILKKLNIYLLFFLTLFIGCTTTKSRFQSYQSIQKQTKNYLSSKNIQTSLRNYEKLIESYVNILRRNFKVASKYTISQKTKKYFFIYDSNRGIIAYPNNFMSEEEQYLIKYTIRVMDGQKKFFILPSESDMEDDIEDLPDKLRVIFTDQSSINEIHIISKDMFRKIKKVIMDESRQIDFKDYKSQVEAFLALNLKSSPKLFMSYSVKTMSEQALKLSKLLDNTRTKQVIYGFKYWNNSQPGSFTYMPHYTVNKGYTYLPMYIKGKLDLKGNFQIFKTSSVGEGKKKDIFAFYFEQNIQDFKRKSKTAHYKYNIKFLSGSLIPLKMRWISKSINPLHFVFDIIMKDQGVITLNIFEGDLPNKNFKDSITI